jgi:hypothetical protein
VACACRAPLSAPYSGPHIGASRDSRYIVQAREALLPFAKILVMYQVSHCWCVVNAAITLVVIYFRFSSNTSLMSRRVAWIPKFFIENKVLWKTSNMTRFLAECMNCGKSELLRSVFAFTSKLVVQKKCYSLVSYTCKSYASLFSCP